MSSVWVHLFTTIFINEKNDYFFRYIKMAKNTAIIVTGVFAGTLVVSVLHVLAEGYAEGMMEESRKCIIYDIKQLKTKLTQKDKHVKK